MRVGLRTLAAFMVAALGFVGLAGTTAGAAPAAKNPSFVGSYAVHGVVTGTTQHLRGTLTLNAGGTGMDQKGNHFRWSNSGKTVTLQYHDKSLSETFIGTQTKKGISSKKAPGTFTTNVEGIDGTWWAIRIS